MAYKYIFRRHIFSTSLSKPGNPLKATRKDIEISNKPVILAA